MEAPAKIEPFHGILTRSPSMLALLENLKRVAPTKAPVLITGESGTGKELFAKATHKLSPRKDKPFQAVNCGAIPKELLESELFGHTRGAFTGAVAEKKGLFEEANGGTLFLDEIGEMPVELQVKLLRALQEEEIRRIGASDSIKLDVRFVTATNRNLQDAIRQGQFREDLYYRINVFNMQIPPLRDRREDIELLAEYYIQRLCDQNKLPSKRLTEQARAMLRNYPWPGNVREMLNALEQTVVLMGPRDLICDVDLPAFLEQRKFEKKRRITEDALREQLSIEDYTKRFIETFQDEYSEKVLAERLGVTPKTLWEKRRKWNMPREKGAHGPNAGGA